jgi:hypothetical protein
MFVDKIGTEPWLLPGADAEGEVPGRPIQFQCDVERGPLRDGRLWRVVR